MAISTIGEMTDRTNEALAFPLIPLCWNLGTVAALAIPLPIHLPGQLICASRDVGQPLAAFCRIPRIGSRNYLAPGNYLSIILMLYHVLPERESR